MPPENAKGVVGVALAGGRSRRMGRDKTALIPAFLGDQTLLQWTIERLEAVCDQWLVADRGAGSAAQSVPDGAGEGPVAGLLGAADQLPGHPLLALACDLPLVPTSALRRLLNAGEGYDWAVPTSEQGPEPLCALYSPRALDTLRLRVAQGRLSLRRLGSDHAELRCLHLPIADLWPAESPSSLHPELMFTNMNRPEDVQKIEILAANSDAVPRFLRLDSTKR